MSQENVEIVREAYERFVATGEFVADLGTDDFVWDMSNFHGLARAAGVRRRRRSASLPPRVD